MNYDEFASAVESAEHTLRFADRAAERLASLLVGRLRKIDRPWVLAALKKELQDFNAHTKEWK